MIASALISFSYTNSQVGARVGARVRARVPSAERDGESAQVRAYRKIILDGGRKLAPAHKSLEQ